MEPTAGELVHFLNEIDMKPYTALSPQEMAMYRAPQIDPRSDDTRKSVKEFETLMDNMGIDIDSVVEREERASRTDSFSRRRRGRYGRSDSSRSHGMMPPAHSGGPHSRSSKSHGDASSGRGGHTKGGGGSSSRPSISMPPPPPFDANNPNPYAAPEYQIHLRPPPTTSSASQYDQGGAQQSGSRSARVVSAPPMPAPASVMPSSAASPGHTSMSTSGMSYGIPQHLQSPHGAAPYAMEGGSGGAGARFSSTLQTNPMAAMAPKPASLDDALKMFQSQRSSQYHKSIRAPREPTVVRCYKCNSEGHIARDCAN